MISVNDFLRSAKPKSRSKLLPFKDDIVTLKAANLSNQKICEFLKLNGVEVSHQRVAVFLKEQGFNNNKQHSPNKVERRIDSAISAKQNTESEYLVCENLQVEANFAKPSWVPEHINIDDLK